MTLEDLYEEFEARLRGYAWSLTHNPYAAEDLTQETFVRAASNVLLLEQLSRNQRRKWLYSTAKNLFIDQYRRERHGEELMVTLRQPESGDDPTLAIDALSMLDGLAPRDRDIIVERFVNGLNSSEIAEDMGIPAATVRPRIRLTLGCLRKRSELW